jgi:hypothetical protein
MYCGRDKTTSFCRNNTKAHKVILQSAGHMSCETWLVLQLSRCMGEKVPLIPLTLSGKAQDMKPVWNMEERMPITDIQNMVWCKAMKILTSACVSFC